MSAEAPPEPVLEPEPDLMTFGPAGPSPATRRALVVLAVVALLAAGAFGVVRLIPHPPPDLTFADLQSVYGGMVRADGTNDVSIARRDQAPARAEAVIPGACAPLFDFTLSNQFPAAAVDGVSTFWLNEGQATISLVTYRYPDKVAARADFSSVSAALDSCAGSDVRVGRRMPVAVSRQQVSSPGRVNGYLSYLVSSGPGEGRFSTIVVLLNNTVSWQYRYDYQSSGSYTTLPAEQLMSTLFTQMRSVQDSHR